MDEYVMKQKIQKVCIEPSAPDGLIQQVVLRARAVAMGAAAQKQLKDASAENLANLASRMLVGQLAAVSQLPKGAQPEQLARQLEQHPAFVAALRGGNVALRLTNGELLQQIVGQQPGNEPATLQITQKQGPQAPTMG